MYKCIGIIMCILQVAEELELRNDDVVDAVSSLMQDNSWKVKAHAIRGGASIHTTPIYASPLLSPGNPQIVR